MRAAAWASTVSGGLLIGGLVWAAGGQPPPAAAEAGREVYARCAACHSIEVDRTGPRHCGLFGRRAGAVPGYAYSEAMRESGIVWDYATLDRFIADPLGTVPGTFMGYAGIRDAEDRARLLAFLEVATDVEVCGSPPGSAAPR